MRRDARKDAVGARATEMSYLYTDDSPVNTAVTRTTNFGWPFAKKNKDWLVLFWWLAGAALAKLAGAPALALICRRSAARACGRGVVFGWARSGSFTRINKGEVS